MVTRTGGENGIITAEQSACIFFGFVSFFLFSFCLLAFTSL
jgi:hypothetical protein